MNYTTDYRTSWANTQKDMTLLMGDLNAKIGKDNIGYEEVMGRHGLGEINDNGEKLLDICASNKLVIGGYISQQEHT